MNLKKAICAFITISLMGAALTGCIKEQNITVEAPQTEIVTNDNGETVTQKNGEPVTVTKPTTTKPETVTVTDKNGKAVTQKDGKAVTATVPQTVTVTDKAGKTITQKNGKPVTETKPAPVTTAKPNAGTTKSTTKKPSNGTAKPSTTKASVPTATQAPAAQPISIRLTKNGNAECSSDKVTISQNMVQIDDSGEFVITQSEKEWHGQIVIRVTNDKSVNVRFENVNISYNSPNIIKIIDASIKEDRSFIEAEATAGTTADNTLKDEMKLVSKQESAPNVDLSFPTGTKSTFRNTSNSFTGVIYNESKLTIKGNGAVEFESDRNANNVICSTKSLTFRNVSASLSTANNTVASGLASSAKGIFAFSKVYVESGNLNIKTNGDCIRCEEFNVTGGNVNIASSAADGIDADDRILIYGGNVTSVALDKSSFKVRRVNNTEDYKLKKPGIEEKDCMRPGKNDTFIINGGTVIGESKKITEVQSASTQASITCKAQKSNKGTADAAAESKVPVKFNIQGIKGSSHECIKFLYSSSGIKAGTQYNVTGGSSCTLTWDGKVGTAIVVSSKLK